jgi:uncharacterized membrane protein YoaK (UPF0700 family)
MYPKRQHSEGRWVTAGALGLSGIAGFSNSAVLQEGSLAVSHLTGSITRVSVELAEGDYSNILPFAVILAAFFAGSVLSGAVVGTKELGAGRRYTVMLGFEAVLFGVAGALAHEGMALPSIGLAAAACGLQNALASSFRGLVVRTTHMTGIVTDLGFHVGQVLAARRRVEGQFALQLSILAAFTLGGVLGAVAAARLGSQSLYISALAAAISAIVYEPLRRRGVL